MGEYLDGSLGAKIGLKHRIGTLLLIDLSLGVCMARNCKYDWTRTATLSLAQRILVLAVEYNIFWGAEFWEI
jgi:hypothetical protein